eukprot:scaffold3134_cov414-Prasinococcus_capsulatus_cf.AAC.28
MPPQLYWLQDYKVSKRRAARGQAESAEVRVMRPNLTTPPFTARNVDYLIRLERWDEDFAEIQAQTPWVAQWLAERRGPEGAREPVRRMWGSVPPPPAHGFETAGGVDNVPQPFQYR